MHWLPGSRMAVFFRNYSGFENPDFPQLRAFAGVLDHPS